ncbi:RNA polymerase sigma factor [Fulvivirga sp. M361]|uniref:RNA polymerase sigma factor n=1 Tax=Fulvivirga sp. M361 TaxID=2594266 RepID=UPI00162A2D74|nr:sigma-70 family RNA polymerase sigma factor [Fulvivirga sp. M361]
MKRRDTEILKYIRAGKNDKAIALLYKSEFKKIASMVRSRGGDEEDAKDVFQDTVLVFYRQLKLGRYNESYEVGAFIFTIARNLWINKLKKDGRLTDLEEVAGKLTDEEDVLEQVLTSEREKKVNLLFAQLGETCRKLLVLAYYQNLSMTEIALKMGFKSEDVAKSKKYKCKKSLIEKVKMQTEFRNELTQ